MLLHICGVIPTLQLPEILHQALVMLRRASVSSHDRIEHRYRRSIETLEWYWYHHMKLLNGKCWRVSWSFTMFFECFMTFYLCFTMFYKCYNSYMMFYAVQQCFTMFSQSHNDRHWEFGACSISNRCIGDCPDRKKYSLLRDKYFREDSRICYLRWKSLNMHSKGKVFYGQEPASGESTTTESGVNYRLLAVMHWSTHWGTPSCSQPIVLNFLLRSKIYHSWFLFFAKCIVVSFRNKSFVNGIGASHTHIT